MQPTDDSLLLQQYAENHSDEAFAGLVRRHINLVYSVALRCVGDPHLAEEVAQAVFILLAKKAAQLRHDKALSSWLFQATRLTASNFVRGETRRHRREQEAHMQSVLNDSGTGVWPRIAPLLDDAVAGLNEKDRDAIVLRFYEGRSLREVGAILGASEAAAEKRVSRAVERLREFFSRRGITVGASGLVVVVSANAVQAAPVGLAMTISTAAFAGTVVQSSIGAAATKTVAVITTQKVLVAVTLVIGVVLLILLRNPNWTERRDRGNASRRVTTNAEANQQAPALTAQEANAVEQDREPDPVNLLRAVAQARQRITSGSMNFQISTDHFEAGRKETSEMRVQGLFDGQKLRFETFGREYRHTGLTIEAIEAAQAQIRAQGLDKAAAVRAGLLEGFEAHDVAAYDGAVLLTYRETDKRLGEATIRDPNEGSSSILFDPRCLGLRTHLSPGTTVDDCFGYTDAKSIKLVGKELVDGEPAWHVSVVSKSGQALDFWIDVARPARLLKHVLGKDYAVSKYDDTAPNDPIPIEVTTMEYHRGSLVLGERFVRSNSRFNQPVDPASFTLPGLNMAIGAEVSDDRNSRWIGYWTGAGLSETMPKKGAEVPVPPKMSELLELLDQAPASPDALEAALWILLNTPDGPEVEKAAGVILQEHTANTNLVYLCKELERVRPRSATNLLEAFSKNNPSVEVRANACFIWANLRKDAAKYGENRQATAEAAKLYERVITEFGRAGKTGAELARRARPELNALRNLIAGKPAPETEGEDLDGNRMNLKDYRGKVVVLIFWSGSGRDAAAYGKQLDHLKNKPVAIIGVNCDKDKTKAKLGVENNQITWPSFWDNRSGPIFTSWNVDSWPTIFVLDAKGVIRYPHAENLPKAVETLLGE